MCVFKNNYQTRHSLAFTTSTMRKLYVSRAGGKQRQQKKKNKNKNPQAIAIRIPK